MQGEEALTKLKHVSQISFPPITKISTLMDSEEGGIRSDAWPWMHLSRPPRSVQRIPIPIAMRYLLKVSNGRHGHVGISRFKASNKNARKAERITPLYPLPPASIYALHPLPI